MAETSGNVPGLGTEPKDRWPKLSRRESALRPIELLRPGSVAHARVLSYLVRRIEDSEEAMSAFYPRWRANEKKVQAYITLPDFEKQLAEMNKNAHPPQVVTVTVPYAFATVSTIVTYLLHVFTGRRPIFQVNPNKEEAVESAANMETVLQYNVEHTRLISQLYQFLQDSQIYGLGVLRTGWRVEKKLRTTRRRVDKRDFFGSIIGDELLSSRELRTVYEGNEVRAQDPFMFFPDPRVPMVEVNRRGEYVFWRSYEGKHALKLAEAEGTLRYVDSVTMKLPHNRFADSSESARALRSGGTANPGEWMPGHRTQNFMQVDQGSCVVIPAELGLGESEQPEKYFFTILNKQQIVQAEPLTNDHGMHPVVVTEPYTMGYGFGHLGMADFLGPIQDTISWLINSHMDNVRKFLNDMLVVDPSRVEMQDLRQQGPGKIIRLKRAAYGQDASEVISQLAIQDVTGQHVKDAETFMMLGERLSAVSDNMAGIQDKGGRKTATEIRTAFEAGASRLAALARVISAQALVDLAEQMSSNIQQYLSEPFYAVITGKDGAKAPIVIRPEMLIGDFNYPVHDGTLPMDRVAMLDVWKEIFMAVAQDPELRQRYSLPKIFEYLAELGGARNVEGFRLQVSQGAQGTQGMPLAALQAPLQAPTPGGPTPGVQPNPGKRLAGRL